jgi:hypothetical protein
VPPFASRCISLVRRVRRVRQGAPGRHPCGVTVGGLTGAELVYQAATAVLVALSLARHRADERGATLPARVLSQGTAQGLCEPDRRATGELSIHHAGSISAERSLEWPAGMAGRNGRIDAVAIVNLGCGPGDRDCLANRGRCRLGISHTVTGPGELPSLTRRRSPPSRSRRRRRAGRGRRSPSRSGGRAGRRPRGRRTAADDRPTRAR